MADQTYMDSKLDKILEFLDLRFLAIDEKLAAQDAKISKNISSSVAFKDTPVKASIKNESQTVSPITNPCQDANFRHRKRDNDAPESQEANYRHRNRDDDPPAKLSYFEKRLSGNFIESAFTRDNTIVRAISNIDPVKSGVLLTTLDVQHVHKWAQDLTKLQRKHPHEELNYCLYISTTISLRINAYNLSKKFFRSVIIAGKELILSNDQLFSLILQIVLPKTEQEWLEDFKKLLQFRKLPKNAHEVIPDTTRYDVWYDAIMELAFEALDIFDILGEEFMPPIRSYNGKAGLMQTFYECIPMGAGKNIHNQINYMITSRHDLGFAEYISQFLDVNQDFQDASEVQKHNRAKMAFGDHKSGMNVFNKSPISNFVNHKSGVNTRYDSSNNFDNRKLVPYTKSQSPFQSKLHNLYDHYDTPNYSDNVDYDNIDVDVQSSYDNSLQFDNMPDNNDYDYDEVFGGRTDCIEGPSPGSNFTNNLSLIDRSSSSDLPCHAELCGKCSAGPSACKFSHDPALLKKAWNMKSAELQASKYKSSPGFQQPAFVPSTSSQILSRSQPHLRAMCAVDEAKVSTSLYNITNENNNSMIFRDKESSFSPPSLSSSTDGRNAVINRGQQDL